MNKGKLGLLITRIGFIALIMEVVIFTLTAPTPLSSLSTEWAIIFLVTTAIIPLILNIGWKMVTDYRNQLIVAEKHINKAS